MEKNGTGMNAVCPKCGGMATIFADGEVVICPDCGEVNNGEK